MDSAEFKTGLSQAEKDFKRSTRRIEAMGASLANVGRNLSLAVTAPLIALGVTSVKAAAESADAIGQVEAALASMGNAAGKTSKQLQELATGQMRQSLYDDDEILRKVTANLLTFGNVAGEQFDRAQQAAIDLSARLGQDLQTSTIAIGKALQEPIKGLASLRRVGIQFTEQQQAQIKAMAEVGDLAGAQAIMLKELERQFGGAARAAREANPMAVLQQSFAEFQETVGEKLLPLLPRITDAITKVLDAFGKLSPGMQEAVIIAAGLAAAFGPLLVVIGGITTALAPFVAGIKLATSVAAAAGVQVGGLTVAFTALRAGIVTLTATLGPYALALAGIATIYYALKLRAGEAAVATEKYKKAQDQANATNEKASGLLAQMATANAKLRGEIIARAKADRQAAIQAIAKAKADLIALRAETARLRAFRNAGARGIGAADPRTAGLLPSAGAGRAIAENRANENALVRSINDNNAAIQTLTQVINSSAAPPAVTSDDSDTSNSSSSRSTGPTAAEIDQRFQDELDNYRSQIAAAEAGMAMSAEERAELELRQLETARRQTLRSIKNDDDYNDAQKAAVIARWEALEEVEKAAIEFRKQQELEQERNDLAQIQFDAQREQLSLAGDLADTQADRKRIALDILKLEQEYRRNQLELVVASESATDAEKARAKAILDSLGAIEAGEKASVGRRNETELEAFLRSYNRSPEQFAEDRLGISLEGIDRLVDGLSRIPGEVESVKDAFRAMRDVFQGVIQDMIAQLIRLQLQKAIAGVISSAAGGAGGGGASSLGGFLAGAGAGFSQGGLVRGPGSGKSDSINARLSDGEFVMNARAVQKIGIPRLHALNQGRDLPGFFLGGLFKSPLFGLAGMAGLAPFGLAGLLLKGEKGPKVSGQSSTRLGIGDLQMSGGGINITNNFPNVTNAREARATAHQTSSIMMQRLAQARREGLVG